MTSKEALEDLFDLLCEREHTNSEHSFYLKLYNIIKQDLEILKILKPILKLNESILYDLLIMNEEEEYNKAKEWLEDDK